MTASNAPSGLSEREASYHSLKTDPAVFDAVWNGDKTFEIRKNDRGFKVGDVLNLRETVHSGNDMKHAGMPLLYTGRELDKRVSHVLTGYGLMDGWCCLSFASRSTEPGGEAVYTEEQIADAAVYAEIPDSKFESLMIALASTPSPASASKEAAPAGEPATKDALLQAAIDFIRQLTGMEPPPVETAPPEVFEPFHAFVNRVMSIKFPANNAADELVLWDEFLAALERIRPIGGRHRGMLKAVKKYRLLERN